MKKYDVVDNVNHITFLWSDQGDGRYSRREGLYLGHFDNLVRNFKGGSVIEFGPGTGEFALKLMERFPITEYTIVDLAKNIGDSKKLFEQNNRRGVFIESKDYEKTFNKKYDLFVSNNCLSEVPKYYLENIFANIVPNCQCLYMFDGDADNGYNEWLILNAFKLFKEVHFVKTIYCHGIAIACYN